MTDTPTIPDAIEIEQAAGGYIEAAFWASTDDEGTPLDDAAYTDKESDGLRDELTGHVRGFISANYALCKAAMEARGYSWARLGHDLWLSRNGHGCGFWDRRELEVPSPSNPQETLGDALHNLAKALRTADLYVGDDGKVYLL